MFQPALHSLYIEPSIFVHGHKMKVIDKITYLKNSINRHCTLDNEISACVKKATDTFAALKKSSWISVHKLGNLQCLDADMPVIIL